MEETVNYLSLSLSNEGACKSCAGYQDLHRTKFPSCGSAVASCTDPGCVSVLGSQVGSLGTCSLMLLTTWSLALQHLKTINKPAEEQVH